MKWHYGRYTHAAIAKKFRMLIRKRKQKRGEWGRWWWW
jgi:hypothetical protein